MPVSTDHHVSITENGRSGSVVYHEPAGTLSFYWEFGGADVLAIIQVDDPGGWEAGHPWIGDRRSEILGYVADEVIRQKAPNSRAEINEPTGEILLRQTGPPPLHVAPDVSFVRRFSSLKAIVGIVVLVVALIFGGVMWFGKKVLMVNTVSGVPLGELVRTETHIAALIQTTDPHLPEISGRGGNETTSISILLIPLDGSKTRLVQVVSGLSANSFGLARIIGSDGHTLWFDATGLHGVRLKDYDLIEPKDLREANPSLDPSWWEDPRGMDILDGKLHVMRIDRSAAIDVDPITYKATQVAPKPSNARFERHAVTDHLAAGFLSAPGAWIGLHSPEELEGEFKAGKWIRPVESADDAKQLRRLCKAELEASTEGEHHRIRSIAPTSDTEYLNAAFLRMDHKAEPLRLADPDGALMIYTSAPGFKGTLMIARVDTEGKIIWKVDTSIDRFKLSQILPGEKSMAFVGTRLPVPDKLSEPLVVIVDNSTGALRTISLWQ